MLRLAYLVSQFPEAHESFIVREIRAVASQSDVDLSIFSLKHCRDAIIQEDARPFVARTKYPSALSSARGLLTLGSRTARRTLREVLVAYRSRPTAQAKALGTIVRAAAVAPTLKRLGSPHIHAHWATMPALAAYFLRRTTGSRYSLTAHAWDIYTDTTMLREKIAAAEFVVTCTAANREHLREIAGPAASIVLSYHGVDFAGIPSPRLEREPGLAILAVGRLVEQKGFRHLIEACALIKQRQPLKCNIIGVGPLRAALEQEVSRRGLASIVTLSGQQPLAAVFDAYRNATVLCVPSVVAADGDRDGIPNVIIEAMSQGLPVVASNVSGIPEIVRADTGWLVPPGDAARLAAALVQVSQETPEVRRRAANAYALVRAEFDAPKNAADLLDQFRRVAARAKNGRAA